MKAWSFVAITADGEVRSGTGGGANVSTKDIMLQVATLDMLKQQMFEFLRR